MNAAMKALLAGSVVISLAMAKKPLSTTGDPAGTTDKVKMDKAARTAMRDWTRTLKPTEIETKVGELTAEVKAAIAARKAEAKPKDAAGTP